MAVSGKPAEMTGAEAVVAALASLSEPTKDGAVNAGSRNYRYMTLQGLLAEVRPKLAACGLAVLQDVWTEDGLTWVQTRLLHTSGELFEGRALALRSGGDPQSVGSASTYGRRYTLAALCGLAGDEDDDGSHATQTARRATPQPARPSGKGSTGSAPPERPAALAVASEVDWSPMPMSARPGPTGGKGYVGATDDQVRYLWALMRKALPDDSTIREWVATVLEIDSDWHTGDLARWQVSELIRRLVPKEAGGEES